MPLTSGGGFRTSLPRMIIPSFPRPGTKIRGFKGFKGSIPARYVYMYVFTPKYNLKYPLSGDGGRGNPLNPLNPLHTE